MSRPKIVWYQTVQLNSRHFKISYCLCYDKKISIFYFSSCSQGLDGVAKFKLNQIARRGARQIRPIRGRYPDHVIDLSQSDDPVKWPNLNQSSLCFLQLRISASSPTQQHSRVHQQISARETINIRLYVGLYHSLFFTPMNICWMKHPVQGNW